MKFDINILLKQVAIQKNTTIDDVRIEIQKSIDIAYLNDDKEIKKNFIKLFGNKKPTIEEFILKIISVVE